MRPLTTAIAASVLLVSLAPFWGRLQVLLQSSVPRGLLLVLGGVFGVAVVAVVVLGVRRIRTGRAMRYALLGGALALAAVPAFLAERESLLTEAIERVHLVLFSIVALLFYRAFAARPESHGRYTALLAWASTVIVGILDEAVQGAVAVRTGEIYDIGLNAYSALVGTLIWVALLGLPPDGSRWPVRGRRRLAVLLAVAVGLLAVFYDRNHLGYRVEDGEIGSFSTYVEPGRFEELNEERRRRWAKRLPGPPFAPLDREDRFLTEAGWRLTHRNHRHDIGDWYSAWKENLILERYFPAVLDLPIVRGGSREAAAGEETVTNRWPDVQRANVDRNRPRPDPVPYVSPVQPGRIFVSPGRGALWGMTVVAWVVLLGTGWRRSPG